MEALQIKCFSNSLTRNEFFNCPELLFLKGMPGVLAPFSYQVIKCLTNPLHSLSVKPAAISVFD